MKKLFTLLFFFAFVQLSFGQLSGTYYIGDAGTRPGGGDPEYTTLSGAVTALNTSGVNGACIFYFTESKTYVDTAASLGCTGTSVTNTITFKPYAGVSATIEFTSILSKNIDGMWVIGSPANLNTNLVSTHYVTIDGSNTDGGTTKDLTIQGPVTALQRSVFRIFGNNDNITIKNCIITNRSSSGSSTSAIQFTNFNASSINYTPDNFTINNNTLSNIAGNGSLGLFLSNSGTPTVGMTGGIISNNVISHRGTRGIMCNYVSDANIFGNSISADMQLSAGAGAGIWLSTGTSAAGTFNIYNNRFTELKTLNNTTGVSNGYIAIDNQFATPKIVNIYNNFIAGFSITSSVSNTKLYGIRHTGSSTSTIYYNTIYIPELTDMTVFGSSFIAGIAFATAATTEASPSGTCTLGNNIIITDETSMKTCGIRRVGTGGTFSTDYNDLYYNNTNASGFVGFWNTSDQQTLVDWQTASSQDANSVSKAVTFVSATDLHLSGGSLGDVDLIGTPLGAPYNVDIDGEARHATFPYMGADENLANPLPVELTSFSATVIGSKVKLSWQTATEINNYGFEVLRQAQDNTEWKNIGFVSGNGNSNSQKSYTFMDESVSLGKYSYRLKQIDNDGKFEFSKAIEVDLGIPKDFQLSQNYPNPFNPMTKIQYTLPVDAQVTLQIYSITGELMESLVSEHQASGSYTIDFDGSNYASGTYIYRLIANDFVQTKKMILIK